MPDSQRIDPEVIEAAVNAYWRTPEPAGKPERAMEAAIRVVLDELGLKEEHSSTWRRNSDGSRQVRTRLVSDWRPVEQGDAE